MALILVSFYATAQTVEDVRRKLLVLSSPSPFMADTANLSKLPKLDYMCDDENTRRGDFYSVVDLNDDGLNDLLYSGPCLPYDQTGIFINYGSKLEKVYDYPGAIISVKKTSSGTVIASLKEPAGCDRFYELTEINIEGPRARTTRISFTQRPTFTSTDLSVTTVKGILRSSSIEDNEVREDECSGQSVRGNHLLTIERDTHAIRLAHAGTWLLVLVAQDGEHSIIGWIANK